VVPVVTRSRFLGSVLILGLITRAPLAAQSLPDRPRMDLDLTYTQFTLGNGLNVLVHRDRSQPIVSVNLWYHVGSKDEVPGRTGFAHLFEHLMFDGSAHVAHGEFDELLEAAGGFNNGSTSPDRTNYWETVPTAALDLAMWLEADRMGWLLDAIDQERLDIERDIVMNERRQSTENRPYGLAWETLLAGVYPPEHPYRWPTIGSMADLRAATLEDVRSFFRRFYHPGNASLAVAGDVSVSRVREVAQRYFGDIPAGEPVVRPDVPQVRIETERREVMEDDVSQARLDLAWISPALYGEGDAELALAADLLGSEKTGRLYQRLVVEDGLAQSVDVEQDGGELGGLFVIEVLARPGVALDAIERAVLEEVARLAQEGPSEEALSREITRTEADFARSLEQVGGFDGKADRLNGYFFQAGDPGFVRRDAARFRAATPESVARWVRRTLVEASAYGLSIVPRGRRDLAIPLR